MGTRRLLYIDHHFEDKRDLIVQFLNGGVDVISVANLKEALGILRSAKVHTILSESQMPDGNAEQLLQTVGSSRTLNRIPVVIISAKRGDGESERYLKLGAADFIEKSAAPGVIVKAVQKALRSADDEITETSIGISGQLAKLKIIDLIGQLAVDHGSGMIVIDGDRPMSIHLKEGQVVHARHGITVGRKALSRCLLIAEAAFHFQGDDGDWEPSIEAGDLSELLDEAKMHNDKLMVNYHRLPNKNQRMRIVDSESLQQTNLKAEARAALEIMRKYPRIGSYLDRFNLPDMVCYEYLLTFLERGFISLVEESKPVWIMTDAGCDLVVSQLSNRPVTVLPTAVASGKERFADKTLANLYKLKTKQLEEATLAAFDPKALAGIYSERVVTHDCLSILTGDALNKMTAQVDGVTESLVESGPDGKPLLANELTRFNSFSFSIGLGLLVEYATELAEEGHQIEAIEERLLTALSSIHMLIAVHPDRSPLARKLKEPVILAWNGNEFKVVEQLGKNKPAEPAIVAEIRRRLDPNRRVRLLIGHVDAPQRGDSLRNEMAKTLRLARIPMAAIGPVSGFRLGNGALAAAFFQP